MRIEFSKKAAKVISRLDTQTKQRIRKAILVKRMYTDDVLTAEDVSDIEEARAEYARGETISGDTINWD